MVSEGKKPIIGIIVARLDKIDGVSLETLKWFWALIEMGYDVHLIFGEKSHDATDFFYRDMNLVHPLFYKVFEDATIIPQLSLSKPSVKKLSQKIFIKREYDSNSKLQIKKMSKKIQKKIEDAIKKEKIDILIAENYSLPMNLPASIAIADIAKKEKVKVFYHNHDFWWERDIYMGVDDELLSDVCPHVSKNTRHAVINSKQHRRLRKENKKLAEKLEKKGVDLVTTIPNVFDDFWISHRPGAYVRELRKALKIEKDDIVLLAPVRIVRRKNLESAIDLTAALGKKAKLVITGYYSDDPFATYYKELREYAREKGVLKNVRFMWRRIGLMSRKHPKYMRYSFLDAYPLADLIIYPSSYEGWGNAFIESIFARKPVVINRYPVYDADIRKYGFDVIEIKNGKITERTIKAVKNLLPNFYHGKEEKEARKKLKKMTLKNIKIARKKLSEEVLEKKLSKVLKKI